MKTQNQNNWPRVSEGVMTSQENWRLIKENPNYMISDLGRVMRIARGYGTWPGRILSYSLDRGGYKRVSLQFGNLSKPKLVAGLVAVAFIGPIPKGKEINHKNGIKIDNRPENLEYVTRSENHKHAIKLGLQKVLYGSNHPQSKLTEKDIYEIRKLINFGLIQKEIAKQFNVCQKAISNIHRKKHWGWLK